MGIKSCFLRLLASAPDALGKPGKGGIHGMTGKNGVIPEGWRGAKCFLVNRLAIFQLSSSWALHGQEIDTTRKDQSSFGDVRRCRFGGPDTIPIRNGLRPLEQV